MDQRVVMTFLPRCGECPACASDGRVPCAAGSAANNAGTMLTGGSRLRRDGRFVHHHLGVSGWATYAVVDRRSVVAVEEDVPADVAALLGCAVLTGGGALLNVGRPAPGETVAVVGLGGVGMAAVLTAIGEPDVQVVGIDPLDSKLDQALSLGVDRVYAPDEAVTEEITAHVVIEAAGSARALETAIAVTGPGGRTVTVGLPPSDARASISPLDLVARGRSIIGSYLGSAVPSRDIPLFAHRWREGRLDVESLISSRIRLDQVNRALDELAAGRAVRQLIDVDDERR